jgi:thiol-disulfide isomerase/thioredoxin
MKKAALALLISTFACAGAAFASPDKTDVTTGTGIGQRIPQFTAQATDFSAGKPKTVEVDSHKTTRPTIYIFIGTHCPATAAYAERLVQLEKTYGPKGVDFVYMYPNNEDTSGVQLTFHDEKKFTGRLIDDHGARLARLLNAQRTTELFLVNKDGVIVYHGAIDDSRDPGAVKERYLTTALDETLVGKPVTTTSSQVSA